jgi:preprotein translocase subunit SecE
MATEEDLKKETAEDDNAEGGDLLVRDADIPVKADPRDEDEAATAAARGEEAPDDVIVPTQLGTRRFVYAAYFAAGIAVAFLLSKFIDTAWMRLSLWKPEFGEPKEELVMTGSAIAGTLVAVYYYRDPKTRNLVDEIANELSKVTWPDRPTVMNSTFVVIVTTLVATTFFALMDRFWGFVTNLVYGAA